MAQSTGPMLAVGAITVGNAVIFNGKDIDWRVPIATGVAAGGLALLERLSPELAMGLAWTALITVLFVPVPNDVNAPLASAARWLNLK